MRKIIADVHNHTKFSDGQLTPFELVEWSQSLGLKAVGITDHDTINGLFEAGVAGKKLNQKIIFGLEATLKIIKPFYIGNLHILFYFLEKLLDYEEFKKDINHLLEMGRGTNLVKERVKSINFYFGPNGSSPILKDPLTVEEILVRSQSITRKHFNDVLRQNHGIIDKETINIILGNESPAYVPSGVEPLMIRNLSNKYPIILVLAHPAAGSFPGNNHYKEILPPYDIVRQIIPDLLNPNIIKINGIEVYYPGHTEEYRKILKGLAKQNNLLITGSSDSHDKIRRPLGVEGMDEAEFAIFEKALQEK